MAKYGGGQFTNLLVDGYDIAPSTFDSANFAKESITQQTNAFGDSSESHSPVGIEKSTIVIGAGLFDATTDPIHAVPAVASGDISKTVRQICAFIEGNIIGQHFIGYEGAYDAKYELMDKKDGVTMAQASYAISGDVNEGVIVQNLTAVTSSKTPPTGDTPVDYTTDTAQRPIPITSNSIAGSSLVTCTKAHGLVTGQVVLISGVSTSSPTINGERTVTVVSTTTFTVPITVTVAGTGGSLVLASTTLGGVGYLHTIAFTGFSSVAPKIVHSTDDSTYTTLVTFTNVTAIGKERITVATGTTVKRYLSSNLQVTGSGSITPFMGFSRN